MGSVHDAYELGGVAGYGRTTRVRLGVRRGDCHPVALKQLRSEHVDDSDRRSRFIRQARRAELLSHDSIEKVLDVLDDDGRPVIVAEWIDGRSLHRLATALRRDERPWPVNVITFITRRLLEGLRHAHHHPTDLDAQGMVHGGVGPKNVLVDIEGQVKLVDFGLAAVLQEGREPWQTLEAMRYLSRDHVRYGASPASDLYAVGAIVHELLSGERFRDEYETEADMRAAIDELEPPPRPREDAPAPLERLRRRLLEPVPNPRVTLEHMLDLCAAVPLGDAQADLRTLVRDALRNDSTQPDSDGDEDGVARARKRERTGPVAHPAANALEQVPLGQSPRKARPRDTQAVPIPHDHEQTAPRQPLFLQQTAPPEGDAARSAEARRSGSGDSPAAVADVDTAPIAVEAGEPGAPETALEVTPSPIPTVGSRRVDPDVTAEVKKAPQLPEDSMPDRARPMEPPPRPPWARLNTPLGWALIGALVAGVGLPLLARCSADDGADSEPKPPGAARPSP